MNELGVSWDDSTCKLIHTKCSLVKKNSCDSKYHMLLNTIFNVNTPYLVFDQKWPLMFERCIVGCESKKRYKKDMS